MQFTSTPEKIEAMNAVLQHDQMVVEPRDTIQTYAIIKYIKTAMDIRFDPAQERFIIAIPSAEMTHMEAANCMDLLADYQAYVRELDAIHRCST